MPKITNGRVSNDGTGTVTFKYDSPVITATTATASTALSVTGNSEGSGSPTFLNQNSNVGNVVLNFASIEGGTNITLDTTSSPGTIIINYTGGGGGGGATEFIQLTDGPEAYSNKSLLYSTANSIAWTAAPSAAGQFLYYNGTTFAFTSSIVTSVAATGVTNQIVVTGSPITSSGTLTIGLASVGTAGTYSTVTVDAYGRVVAGTTSGGSSTVTLAGDVSGTGQTGSTITTTLATVATGYGTFASNSGVGIILADNAKGLVTNSRALTLADLTAVGAAPINSPTFTGTPAAPTPSTNDNTTKIATTAWVNNQGYLVAPLVVTGDASGTSSGSSLTLTLANVVTAGTYSTVTVNAKGLVVAGTQSSGGVTSVALTSPNSTITTAGSPITSTGTFHVDLPTVIVAGTYNTVTVDTYGRVVAGSTGGGGGGISDIGITSTASTITVTNSPLTANGTFNIDLATVGAAGTYTAVGVDAYGRVTSHRALAYSDLPTEVQASLLPFSFPGQPAASIDIVVPIVQNTTIPNNLANTAGYCLTQATASSTFTFSYIRSGTQTTIGTIVFAASTSTPTVNYSLGAALSLVAGDVLVMTTPGTVDSTLSNVGITIYALKA